MKLPNQTKPIERKTYNASAATVGANASIDWGSLVKTGIGIANQIANG